MSSSACGFTGKPVANSNPFSARVSAVFSGFSFSFFRQLTANAESANARIVVIFFILQQF